MRVLGKHLNKAVIVLMMGMVCLLFGSSPMNSYVLANSTAADVSLDAFLQNESIVVSVTPETKPGKPSNGNNGNTINKAQIWGNYGGGWFLIKDYENIQKISKNNNQQYKWDLSSLDKDNESFYWDPASWSNRYTKEESDLFKIYVRYRKDFSGDDKKDNLVELYKTFYLGKPMQDVGLITNSEKDEYTPMSYDFPVVVMQGSEVELYLNADGDMEAYTVKIIGDHYVQNLDVKTENQSSAENQKVYEWVPNECGTFYIDVYDSELQPVLRRKAYVNSENNEYLELGDLSISNINNVVCVRLKVEDTRPAGFDSDIDKSLRFVISEPQVWSKTIKNYGDIVAYNEQYEAFEINEEQEGFSLGSGYYSISAFIKSPHSIEPDDSIERSYSKSRDDSILFELNWQCLNESPDKSGSYMLKKKEPLKFSFQVKEPQEQYEYAFFLKDARGKRMVKDYSQNAEFHWSPADPGEYTVFARIRRIEKTGTLPNSYEKEVSVPIRIKKPDMLVKINSVKLNGNVWSIQNGKAVMVKKGDIIQSHMLHVIEIDAEDKGNEQKSTLMYKISTIGKGYEYPLSKYTPSNYIPFYPRSSGEFRLIVMVKDSISGSEEDRCEIIINVE